MIPTASRRALLAALLASAPASALAQIPGLPRFPRLPFGRKDAGAAPPAPKLSGRRPDLAAILRNTGAPAIGAAAVTPKGLAFLAVSGVRRLGEAPPVTETDVWHLGGCTQAFTAGACARLAAAGRLSLSTRLPALFSGLTVDPGWADARLEDVLAHRAGFTDAGVISIDRVAAARADKAAAPRQRDALAREMLAKPPPRPLGGFENSTVGYVIVAAALERLTGKSFEGVVEDAVFTPLGMKSAGFGAPTPADGPSGHQLDKDGKLHPTPADQPADLPPLFASAGGAHATLQDWARFARVFLDDGGGFLTPDALQRLCRPWGGADGETGASALQVLANRAWADGVVLLGEGSNGLWRAQMEIAPERGLAILAVSNAEEGGGTDAVLRAAQALEQAYGAG